MIGKRIVSWTLALCAAVALGAPTADAQCPTGQLDHDFDLGLAEVLLNRLLVDPDTQESLWDNGQGGGLWQNIPSQVGPSFIDVDNTGNGIDDDDHLDTLAAIINGDATVVAGLNAGTVNTIRTTYANNRNHLQNQEITINNVNVSALFINTTLNVTTGSVVSVPVVGDTEIPSLWGRNEADPNDGLLRSADPNLETLMLNMGAGYMTIGDTADVDYMQAFIAQITLAVIEFVVPALLEDLKKALGVPQDAPVRVVSYQGPGYVDFNSGEKAFTVNCNAIQSIDISVEVSGISARIRINRNDICNALQGFVNKFVCGGGAFTCLPQFLAASGDLNADGTTNLASYNAASSRQDFMVREGIANPPLEIVSAPSDTTVTAGAEVHLSASTAGGQSGGSVTTNWELINPETMSPVGVISAGANYDLSYALPADSIAALGVAVCDGLWSRRSLPIALTVNPAAFAITTQPVGIENTIPGDSHTLTVAVQGGTAIPTYQWQRFDGSQWVNIDGETTTTLEFASLELTDTGNYRVQISGADGAPAVLTSNEVFIEVEDRIRITGQPQPGRIYVGGEHTFTATMAGVPDGALNIQWQKDGNDITGANSLSLTISDAELDDNGDYVLIISDDSYVVPSDAANLEVAEHLSLVSSPSGGTIFEGTLFTFSVETDGGLGPLTYVWTKEGTGTVGPNSADFTLNPVALSDAGTYSVTVTDINNETVTSATATINVIPPFEITTQPVGKLDFEGSATHTFEIDVVGGAPPFQFQWFKDGAPFGGLRDAANRNLTIEGPLTVDNSGDYRCFVTDTNGGKFSNTAVLDIRTHLTISQQPEDVAVYIGGSTQLSIGLSGGIGDREYRWKKGAVTVAFTETLQISNAQTFSAGTYTVTVEDDFDTVTSESATVSVGTPLEITQQPQNAWRFLGDTATLSVSHIKGAGEISYEWFHNGEPVADSNSATLSLPSLTADLAGDYHVVITDGVTSYTSSTAVLTAVEPLANTGGDVDVSLDPTQAVPPTGLLASAVLQGSLAYTGGVTDNYLLVASSVNTPLAGIVGVELRRGLPGANGPLVESMGVPTGSTLSVFEVLTSAEAAEMVAGVHYVIYATGTFSTGAIRGQVVVTPRPPLEEEGEGGGEGIVDGEGGIDGEEGEEGEGVVDGEGEPDGAEEGEGVVEGEGEPDGAEEGEGEDISPIVILLLQSFSAADANADGVLSVQELTAVVGPLTIQQIAQLDANSNGNVQASELLHITGPMWLHNADLNGDLEISLGDLLRAVQLFNQGGYSCAANAGATEDGFVATPGGADCPRHASDYAGGEDNQLTLQELLRLIQLYNAGGYDYCPDDVNSEDGYCVAAG